MARPPEIKPPGPRPPRRERDEPDELVMEAKKTPVEVVTDLLDQKRKQWLELNETIDELRRHNTELRAYVAQLEQRKGFDEVSVIESIFIDNRHPAVSYTSPAGLKISIQAIHPDHPDKGPWLLWLVGLRSEIGTDYERLERAALSLMHASQEALARAKEER